MRNHYKADFTAATDNCRNIWLWSISIRISDDPHQWCYHCDTHLQSHRLITGAIWTAVTHFFDMPLSGAYSSQICSLVQCALTHCSQWSCSWNLSARPDNRDADILRYLGNFQSRSPQRERKFYLITKSVSATNAFLPTVAGSHL